MVPPQKTGSSHLKQQRRRRRRRRLRKPHLQSEVALLQTYSISFNLSNVGSFLELNSKILYRSSGKEKESRCLVFMFSTKREIKAFSHRSRAVTARKCTKKRDARAKMLFCQSKPTAFLPFLLTSPSSLLKLPKIKMIGTLLSVMHRQVHKNKQ